MIKQSIMALHLFLNYLNFAWMARLDADSRAAPLWDGVRRMSRLAYQVKDSSVKRGF